MTTLNINSAAVRTVEVNSYSVRVNFATTVKDVEIGDRNFRCTEEEKSLRTRVSQQTLQIPDNLKSATACMFKIRISGSQHSVAFEIDDEGLQLFLKDPAVIACGICHPLQLPIQGLFAMNIISQSQATQAVNSLVK